MFIVVCYDIADDNRRNKVSEILEGFGERVQRSVFECDITPDQFERLKRKLSNVIKEEEDSVRFYFVCGSCISKFEMLGTGPPPKRTSPYFII